MPFSTVSPGSGDLLFSREFASPDAVSQTLDRGQAAYASWRLTPRAERIALVSAMVDAVVAKKDDLATELAQQVGRPIRYCAGEIGGFEQRAKAMIAMADDALADVQAPTDAGFTRFVRRVPLGLVLVLSPWNYPWLTAVNAVVPALVAGNVVVLKHSEQTALVAERWAEAAEAAGLPEGVFQYLHATHDTVAEMVADERVDHVCFTGSVEGGHAIVQAASKRFVGIGLELGGKDPAYVRADADVANAAENLVDGACFNSGQSCCGIERIYVHKDSFDAFVEAAAKVMSGYVLGDPLDPETTLGPLVRTRNAAAVRAQIADAEAAGARGVVPDTWNLGGAFVAPNLYVDVNHDMALMATETFGPVVGVMPVDDDDHAVRLMNDSRYGLTASVWTTDEAAALVIGERLETGTVFMNRCDYLDPHLAWTGVKDSGRGATLSRVGYEQLTRPKSFHLRRA